jgi:hypothetical protein
VIRIDGSPEGLVRIIGVLQGEVLRELFESLGTQEAMLDLSEVREADAEAVRMLAQMPPGRCKLVHCSKWLALWIEQERRLSPTAVIRGSPT